MLSPLSVFCRRWFGCLLVAPSGRRRGAAFSADRPRPTRRKFLLKISKVSKAKVFYMLENNKHIGYGRVVLAHSLILASKYFHSSFSVKRIGGYLDRGHLTLLNSKFLLGDCYSHFTRKPHYWHYFFFFN